MLMLGEDPDRADEDVLVDAFQRVLGDTCRLGRFASLCRWNVVGAEAAAAEREFLDQADELSAARGAIASHIRGLGSFAQPAGPEAALERALDRSETSWAVERLYGALAQGHEAVETTIRAAADIAEGVSDYGSLHLLGERARAHARHLWRCRMQGP
ncbi:MAG: ferritin-like domain-containing protein [Pseudomonadota bacterium]